MLIKMSTISSLLDLCVIRFHMVFNASCKQSKINIEITLLAQRTNDQLGTSLT